MLIVEDKKILKHKIEMTKNKFFSIFAIMAIAILSIGFFSACTDKNEFESTYKKPQISLKATDQICAMYLIEHTFNDRLGLEHKLNGIIVIYCDEYGVSHMQFVGQLDDIEIDIYFFSPGQEGNPNPDLYSLVIDDMCVLAISEKDLDKFKRIK